MKHKLFLLMPVICVGIHAADQSKSGEQSKISRQCYRSQSGDVSRRGKKRNQKPKPSLEAFARAKFPGPDVQSSQAKYPTSSENRNRAKAWKEAVLLEETTKTGSAEQCAAVKVLLKAKVHPDMKYLRECGISIEGSPLRNAAYAGNHRIMKLLLDAGADPNGECWFKCKRGFGLERPLLAAARAKKALAHCEGLYVKAVRMLCKRGAIVNFGGESQEFPFAPIHMIALQRPGEAEQSKDRLIKQVALLDVLLEYGADLHRRTANGFTAAELARKRGSPDFADHLEQCMNPSGTTYFNNDRLKPKSFFEKKAQKILRLKAKKARMIKRNKERDRKTDKNSYGAYGF